MNNEYATVELRVQRREQMPDTANLQELLQKWGMQLNAQETFWVIAFDGARNMRSSSRWHAARTTMSWCPSRPS